MDNAGKKPHFILKSSFLIRKESMQQRLLKEFWLSNPESSIWCIVAGQNLPDDSVSNNHGLPSATFSQFMTAIRKSSLWHSQHPKIKHYARSYR
jgi:hypothetical protein